MLSKQLLASLSLFAILGAINSDEDKSCIDAPPVKNFNATEYYGHFYQQAFEDESRANFDCLQYLILPLKEGGTYPLVKIYKEKSDNSTHMVFKNIMIDSTGHGINSNKESLTVVGTDYYNYLVTFACDESTNTRVVSVLSGTAQAGFSATLYSQNVLDQYNISYYSLSFMNQDDCPVDWSDAKMDEADFTYDEVKAELIDYNITTSKLSVT